MYMIEISEDKIDHITEHLNKGMRCLAKVAQCFEEIRDGHDGYDEEDDYDEYAIGGRRNDRYESRRMNRGGGRYSRY